MLKVQQKIAGSFRADSGSEACVRIRGYCTWLRKQGVALLDALETVYLSQPLYPALAGLGLNSPPMPASSIPQPESGSGT
jgi:hypothetical protein